MAGGGTPGTASVPAPATSVNSEGTDTMTVTARKYNPGFLTDDDLVASLSVRIHEFASILEMLRECTGRSNTYQIVIGPRGSGKTSLLLRVAAEMRRAPELQSDFFPMESLLDLIDDHTEYFKSHLEALPAQERRVYLALAALWTKARFRSSRRTPLNRCSIRIGGPPIATVFQAEVFGGSCPHSGAIPRTPAGNRLLSTRSRP